MKKGFTVVLAVLFMMLLCPARAQAAQVPIDEDHFPDEVFRIFVETRYDKNGDGILSDRERLSVREMDVSPDNVLIVDAEIWNLAGIEYFPNLETLCCRDNHLDTLILSKNTKLKELDCAGNRLHHLELADNAMLQDLDCSGNDMYYIELGACTGLYVLDCSGNHLSEMDLSCNTAIYDLICSKNDLTALDLSANKGLIDLICSDNKLKALNVSHLSNLHVLDCSKNSLKSLDLSGNRDLQDLDCSGNRLSSLDVSVNSELNTVRCSENRLTALNLSKNQKLELLECQSNDLTTLVVPSEADLIMLDCRENAIATLDISANKALIFAYTHGKRTSKEENGTAYIQYLYELEEYDGSAAEPAEEVGAPADVPGEIGMGSTVYWYMMKVDTTTRIKATPFKDVSPSKFYERAVAWANFEGITKGKTSTSFAPNDNLTRGEFCTMLWRMYGKQSVSKSQERAFPFADAKKSNHYKAILWCYSQGIIKGYTENGRQVFRPARTITRGNILVMLFKLAKQTWYYKAPTIKNPYQDIKDNNKNLTVYRWAYENEITTTTTLKPGDACRRSAMVSFLYGYYNAFQNPNEAK